MMKIPSFEKMTVWVDLERSLNPEAFNMEEDGQKIILP